MTTPAFDFVLAKAGSMTLRVAPGKTIFSEGEPGDRMYYLRRGHVQIESGGHVLDRLEPGSIFGEMSLIDGSPRSATASAIEECEISVIDEDTFMTLVDEAPYFALDVMRVMAERIRRLNQLL